MRVLDRTSLTTPAEPSAVWARIESLVDDMSENEVRAHDLAPAAALRWRTTGRAVPADFARAGRAATLAPRIATAILERARVAYDGPMLLFKGPEVAALYPYGTRFFSDLDLLVDEASAAQAALAEAGFLEVDDPEEHFADLHHLTPLYWPGLPFHVEIHSRPKWPSALPLPPVDEILEAAVPSRLSVERLLAPSPVHHALMLVGHAWAHMPLRSIRSLLDTALVAAEADPAEIDEVAERWGVERPWRTNAAICAWLFGSAPTPPAVVLWGRHLLQAREQTVLEGHVERWLSPFWMLPPAAATRCAAKAFGRDFARVGDESWGTKSSRVGRATANAFRTRSQHGWHSREGPRLSPRRRERLPSGEREEPRDHAG